MSFASGRATRARRTATALVLVAALGLSSCQAVPPTAPAPTAGGIAIGAYTNVTNQHRRFGISAEAESGRQLSRYRIANAGVLGVDLVEPGFSVGAELSIGASPRPAILRL